MNVIAKIFQIEDITEGTTRTTGTVIKIKREEILAAGTVAVWLGTYLGEDREETASSMNVGEVFEKVFQASQGWGSHGVASDVEIIDGHDKRSTCVGDFIALYDNDADGYARPFAIANVEGCGFKVWQKGHTFFPRRGDI